MLEANTVSTTLSAGDFTPHTGTTLTNYTLPTSASGGGNISARNLTINYFGLSKSYDGSTVASVTTTDNRVVGDVFDINRTANFDNKNVGTGKTISVSGVSLSDPLGATTIDASNYIVSSTGTTSASVTRLGSVAWTGGTTGNWLTPGNWAGGAVPDLANVASVFIPSGVTVTFNDTPTGLAQSGPVLIDSLSASGSAINQSAGALRVTGVATLGAFQQSGGTATVGGNFTTTSGFSQGSTGSLTVGGTSNLASTATPVVLGNFATTGALNITSTGGSITQASGTSVLALDTITLSAQNGSSPADITLDNSSNRWVGLLNVTNSANLYGARWASVASAFLGMDWIIITYHSLRNGVHHYVHCFTSFGRCW